MSSSTLQLNEKVQDYLLGHSLRESTACQQLREETRPMKMGMMQVSPEQGQFMAFLVELPGARKAVEVGTFTGYSALCVAQALPEEGTLVCCDVSEEWTAVGKKHWEQAGVSDRIDLRIGPAVDTLKAMCDSGEEGSFDFGFIDADKTNYQYYYEHVLALLRTGGLLLIDNVLWGGKVLDPSVDDADTVALRELNARIVADNRVEVVMLSVGDGLTLVRRI